jgi:flagellar biosynthesis/type III secretory pathway protein FliH
MSDATFTSWHPRVLQVESEGSQPSPKELREQAQEEGYAQGYAEGLEAGRKESNIQANAKIAQLQSLVDALDRPFHQQELKVSEYLLSLVSTICSSILRRELSTDAERIRDTLDRALELLSGERGQVTLLLHPDDMAAVTDTWSDDLGELRVEPAPDVIRGGCRIHRNDSLVDATVETQLRNTIMDLARIPGPVGSSGEPGDLLDGAEVQSVINRLEAGGNDSE